MKSRKFIITGSAGFIGFYLAESLLKDGHEVHGIDNINNYYNVNLKKMRLEILKKFPRFTFSKVDISRYNKTKDIFKKIRPNIVVNLAAQAGVRYSIKYPQKYINSNIVGFSNVIQLAKEFDVDNFIYASSSSVYGNSLEESFCESDRVDKPISLYAATKSSNELIAHTYSHIFGLKTTGLRFFTVYGPMGRPDMAYFLFSEKIFSNKKINVYNNGNMFRDFTYITDIIRGVKLAIEKKSDYEIFNLGNNKSENLMKMIEIIENKLNLKARINYLPIQPGDVTKTFANIDKSKNILNYKPEVALNVGLDLFLNWFINYKEI